MALMDLRWQIYSHGLSNYVISWVLFVSFKSITDESITNSRIAYNLEITGTTVTTEYLDKIQNNRYSENWKHFEKNYFDVSTKL
jgi:hypothetical protein